MTTVPQIELVSVDSGRLLKVVIPHFHFDSNLKKKKKDTHPATELFIVNPFLIAAWLNRFWTYFWSYPSTGRDVPILS